MGYYPPDDDDSSTEPTDRTAVTDSVADVEPPGDYLDEFPHEETTVPVVIPREVARSVAHRTGAVSARGKTVTEHTVADFAADHATVTPRFLVPSTGGSHTPLTAWVEQHDVPVERTEGGRHEGDTATLTPTDDGRTRAHVAARAEYRPGEDAPLVVTVDVPDHLLKLAGGWEQLTDTVEVRQAADE